MNVLAERSWTVVWSAHPAATSPEKGTTMQFSIALPRSSRRLTALLAIGAAAGCGASSDAAPTQPNLEPTFKKTAALSFRPFPADNWWNTDISTQPVDSMSATLIASCGTGKLHPDFGTTFGIPYVVIGGGVPRRPVSFDIDDESDPGPYPIPTNAPIEDGPNSTGDRHVLVVDTLNRKLYEMWDAHPLNGGASWHSGSGAVFDLSSNALRPSGWTSADAAGLPVFPGLVRYDEAVQLGAINHAVRFTCPHTRKGFITPARHFASSSTSTSLPPMGMRVRLKASFNVSGFPAEVQVMLRAMQKYGMILADNGSGWFVSGAPDSRWNDSRVGALKTVPSSAFEVVKMGPVMR